MTNKRARFKRGYSSALPGGMTPWRKTSCNIPGIKVSNHSITLPKGQYLIVGGNMKMMIEQLPEESTP